MDKSRDGQLPVLKLSLLFSLYFAQGLPSGFLAHTLPALMRVQGVSLEYIGLIKLLALPWVLKFLWAPYVDRIGLRSLGPNKTWIISMQLLLGMLMFVVSFSSEHQMFGTFLLIFLFGVVLVNLASATQDIATDGLAVNLLPIKMRGLVNSIQVSGFKVGMILTSSLMLLGFEYLGWSTSFRLLALMMMLLMIPAMLYKPLLAAVSVTEKTEYSIYKTYLGFFRQAKIWQWILVLCTYKFSDALGSAMIKPMLVDQGFSLSDLAEITFYSSIVGLLGAVAAGGLFYRYGAKKLLLGAGALQAVGIASYALIVEHTKFDGLIYSISMFEQFVDGLSTVALFSVMMSQCRLSHEGADYTVQASLLVLLSGLVGVFSGLLASSIGFQSLFLFSGMAGLLALLPVMFYYKNNC